MNLHQIAPYKNGEDIIQAVVDTPMGSRAKYKYDGKLGQFRLGKLLPLGASFPYNFGFVPGTRGEDGDALDIMILRDEPVTPGTIVPTEIIGMLIAQQKKSGGKI